MTKSYINNLFYNILKFSKLIQNKFVILHYIIYNRIIIKN